MNSRVSVLERVSPWIRAEHLDIRSAPILVFARGGLHQSLQSLFRGRVSVQVDMEPFERILQLRDIGHGCADFGVVGCADELGNDGCGQNTENDDHHHDFDQGESARPFLEQTLFHTIILPFL